MRASTFAVVLGLFLCVSTAGADLSPPGPGYIRVDINGQFPDTTINNYFASFGSQSGFQSVAEATEFMNASQVNTPFAFTFFYNPDDTRVSVPNYGLRFTDVSLGSGQHGTYVYEDYTVHAYITSGSSFRMHFHLLSTPRCPDEINGSIPIWRLSSATRRC